ncbi:MAG: transketolase [Chlamydia sp.]
MLNDISASSASKDVVLPLDHVIKQQLSKIALAIRVLSMDAVQKADSGHPGLPLGCAELGAYLYGYLLKHNPKNPDWLNRDRMILSAGHGSMWLYSCLHLSGFSLSLDDIRSFRQLHSKTPGHPESKDTEGVETTTGPLGQGVANGIGTALGLKILGQKFNSDEFALFSSKVYILAGDGCMMEGVSAEASSLAGHLGLDNVVLLYDSNDISLDGPLSDSCSENTKMRYQAYGWDVFETSGHDFDQMHLTIQKAIKQQTKPVLIVIKTEIGHGSPNKAGSSKAHGSPLGSEEIQLTKAILGVPLQEDFYVPQLVRDYFKTKCIENAHQESEWQRLFDNWSRHHPERRQLFDQMISGELPQDLEKRLSEHTIATPTSGRKASQDVIGLLSTLMPSLYGGSADLSCSDLTMIKNFGVITPKNFSGRNIKYGVREFAMASMATGLAQTKMIRPFVGTFLTFSDYMRNAIRLAAIMREPVIYQFTHDSILLGEDGPTHQPVEHLASLRAIPHLHVIRPAGPYETKMAWYAALITPGPTAFILSRQNIRTLPETERSYEEGVGRGAYILRKARSGEIDYTLIATGSEVPLAVDVADALEKLGKNVQVVSMPSWFLFEKQSAAYKKSLFGPGSGRRVVIEAASEMGWHKYIGENGIACVVEGFGASAPQQDLAKEYGFTVEAILDRLFTS